MRHTFATKLDETGTSLRTIQELGRWADIRMVQRYSNISERNKREAIERLSKNFYKSEKPNEIAANSSILRPALAKI
jgi:site-specific recombinase XerD